MTDLEVLAEVVYLRSSKLLAEMQQFYRQNERWLSPQQRYRLRVGMNDITRLLKMCPARHEALPHQAVGGVLDALYSVTYGAVGKLLPARRKS